MSRQVWLIIGLAGVLLAYFVAMGVLTGGGPRTLAESTGFRGMQSHNAFLFQLASEGGLGPNQISHGTAFNIAGNSTWLTARHVVAPCLTGRFRASVGGMSVGAVTVSNMGDIAQIASGRTHRQPLVPVANFEGEDYTTRGIIVGYANENLTAVAVQQIGIGNAHTRSGDQTVSVWTETGRSTEGSGSLGGMSGSPVIDQQGRAVGVLSAEVPRRGRVLVAQIEPWAAQAGGREGQAQPFGDQPDLAAYARRVTSAGAVSKIACATIS